MANPPRSSRLRYRAFVEQYHQGTLGEADAKTGAAREAAPAPDAALAPKGRIARWRESLLGGSRKDYLRDYLRWLKPHRGRLAAVCALALLSAAAQSGELPAGQFVGCFSRAQTSRGRLDRGAEVAHDVDVVGGVEVEGIDLAVEIEVIDRAG